MPTPQEKLIKEKVKEFKIITKKAVWSNLPWKDVDSFYKQALTSAYSEGIKQGEARVLKMIEELQKEETRRIDALEIHRFYYDGLADLRQKLTQEEK